jgi:hypothetical protein
MITHILHLYHMPTGKASEIGVRRSAFVRDGMSKRYGNRPKGNVKTRTLCKRHKECGIQSAREAATRISRLAVMREQCQVFFAFAGGASATAASLVRKRKVKLSCRYRRTAVSVWFR